MRSEHLHYLLEIDRLHSISSAARTLHVRQTTLSAIVKALEDELGFSIFRRTPSGVVTTPEGEQLISLAWEMDVRFEELLSLKKNDGRRSKSIPVALCPSINLGLAIPLCRNFYRFDLRGDLVLSETPRRQVLPSILQSQVNLGVTYLTPEEIQQTMHDLSHSSLRLSVLLEDQFYLCVPAGHPLAGREQVSREDFRQERLATVTSFQADGEQGRRDHSLFDGRQAVFLPNIDLMHQAMAAQGLAGVVTSYAFRHSDFLRRKQHRLIPLCRDGAPLAVRACLLCREERYLRYQERILVSCILDYFRSEGEESAG